MTSRRAFAICLLAAASFAVSACTGVGSVGDDDGIIDEPTDELCAATLTVTGSFQPVGTGVSESGSCVPIGTWTVNVEVDDLGDCTEVPTVGQYIYQVTEVDEEWVATFVADPDNDNILTKVGTEGECIGTFEHWSDDGKTLTLLRPYTLEDFSLAGVGAFEVYEDSQL